MKPSKILLLACAFVFLSCGPSSDEGGDPCTGTASRCDGDIFQECVGGKFQDQSVCAGTTSCSASLGCVECAPEDARACVGDEVYTCNEDGTLGDYRERCDFEQCNKGSCGENRCGTGTTELIYVVDTDANFLSFDPTKIGSQPFALIGTLSCSPGPSIRTGDIGPATPFSMSVDRTGTAWVLYSSGEIFHVSTDDASCQSTSWVPKSGGFELFGMGFVSDAAGSDAESLYISGGDASDLVGGNLGTINRFNLQVSSIGPLPNAEQSPELTGTGDAKLYGYFPGMTTTFVANIDKGNSTRGESWNTTQLQGGATAWAFAHWGGRFYIFATSGQFVPKNAVYELDPMTGATTTVVSDSPYRVVGAGVSTCAPTQID